MTDLARWESLSSVAGAADPLDFRGDGVDGVLNALDARVGLPGRQ